MNIVVLCGGISAERDVSLCTGSLVTKALLEKEHNAVLIDMIEDYEVGNENYKEYIETCRDRILKVHNVPTAPPDIQKIKKEIFSKRKEVLGKNVLNLCMASDIVFMALHGEDGEDGRIQALLDVLGVKYTGSGYLGSALAMNKGITKQIFKNKGILTPEFKMLTEKNFDNNYANIKLPCVVKPSTGGSSIGVYIVKEGKDLKSAIEKVFKLDNEIIIEEYIEGIEYTCAILEGRALPIVEITPKEGFYDYNNKYQKDMTKEICPATSLTKEETLKMQKNSVEAHKVLNLEVYSRADFIVDTKGNQYCLEVNTLPGMTPTSLLPQEAKALGIKYNELCNTIIEVSLKKY